MPMSLAQIVNGLIIIALTIVSGLADAQGAIHAAKIWQEGHLVWDELGKSALGFGVGIFVYWIVIRFMKEVGIVAPEVQAVLWFGVMMIGVALFNGAFFRWQRLEQVVAIAVLVGIGWLSFRTGA
jgi:hypothetical protein